MSKLTSSEIEEIIRAVVEWGSSECTEHILGLRRQCYKCWKQLGENNERSNR